MNTIFERRSVNFFDQSRTINEDLLKEIIDVAVTAPSAFNLQPWEVIAVKTPESKEKLHALANKQPKVLEAPVTLIIVGDREGYAESNPVWKQLEQAMGDHVKGAKDAANFLYGSTDERKIKFAESNAGLLAMSIMYAAKDLGVDSHPMSGIDFEGIKVAFGLKPSQEVVMMVALGYFDTSKTLHPRAPRRGFEEIVSIV